MTSKHDLMIITCLVWACLHLVQADVVPTGFSAKSPIKDELQFANANLAKDESKELILTPYIEAGKLAEARRLSEVHLEGVQIQSYSGFFTVNKTYNSNMFFWFFPPMVSVQNRLARYLISGATQTGKTRDVPVMFWLAGGPGGSFRENVFEGNGPFQMSPNMSVSLQNFSWNQEFGLLFIDNPVGTGYSFTDNDKGKTFIPSVPKAM